ncbi:MAG: DUF2812 domain-containing protein [Pygmaiobacter sp.]
MSTRVFRFYGGFVERQQAWLNAMAKSGYRLKRTGKLLYEFDRCKPDAYCYCIDFVAEKSNAELCRYKTFLQELGYTVFSKSINLNWSVGKVSFRPYGEGRGKLASSPGTYNHELLIVEKQNDGSPFCLHSTPEDQLRYYIMQRNAYLTLAALGAFLCALGLYQSAAARSVPLFAAPLCIGAALPALAFERKCRSIQRAAHIQE